MVDDPNVPRVPHMFGVTLVSSGVANTLVVVTNRRNGDFLIKATDTNSVVVFDAADFTSQYALNDVFEFQNVGASVGGATTTLTDETGNFQTVDITAAAAPTVSISL